MISLLLYLCVILVPHLVLGDHASCKNLPSWTIDGIDPILSARNDAKVSVVMFAKAG